MNVSVVVAVYNGSQYIIEQLDSLMRQSVKIDEVLIFDDKSTDGTYDLVLDYIKKNNLIDLWKVKRNSVNKGWRKNFIDGINQATGDIIFLSDQDDIWELNKIETMKNIMQENNNINVLASNFDVFYDGVGNDAALTGHQLDKYGKDDLECVHMDRMWLEPLRPGCCMCFRKKLIPVINKLWFEECAHDLLLWGIGIATQSAYIYNKVLLHQRRHVGTSTPSNQKSRDNRSKLMNIYYVLSMNILKESRMLMISDDNDAFMRQMADFYKERYEVIKKPNIIKMIKMARRLNKYPKKSSYLADIYSAIH